MSRPSLIYLARGSWLAVLALGAILLPCSLDSYHIFVASLFLTSMLAVLGLNILVGYTGQISLGHGAFYAIGAYATALLIGRLDLAYWIAPLVAGVLCFAVGFMFGIPALRLEGHYLALATFTLAVSAPQILKWSKISELTGGVQGVLLDKPRPPFFFAFGADRWLYYLTLAHVAVLFTAAAFFLHGRIGRELVAVRDHPTAARTMGIHVALLKVATFAVSAAFAGIAGSLAALLVQFVSPDSYDMFLSISLLIGVVVGGGGSLLGAALGGAFIQFVPLLTSQVSKSATWAIYGLILLVVGYVLPRGFAGLIARLPRPR